MKCDCLILFYTLKDWPRMLDLLSSSSVNFDPFLAKQKLPCLTHVKISGQSVDKKYNNIVLVKRNIATISNNAYVAFIKWLSNSELSNLTAEQNVYWLCFVMQCQSSQSV